MELGAYRSELDRFAIGSPQPPGGGLQLRVPQVRSERALCKLRPEYIDVYSMFFEWI